MSEAANTLRSSATSRVVIAMCEGEIKGLVDGHKSVYFGDTPLQASDGTYNFQGVTVETRNGTPDQAYLAGFPAVENDVSVEADVTFTGSITRRIDNASANAARVRVQLTQGLMSQNSSTGDLNASSVSVAIEVRPSGGVFTRMVEDTITGKTTSAYEKTYRVGLTGSAPWDLRVVRLTADSETAYLRNSTRWSSYTEIIDRKCTYPHTALLGVAVDGQKFGSSVPTLSAEIYGRILLVPANYDPATRAYTGIWDGTFKLAWSDNAAWCFYDMILNTRYGLGIADSGLKWYLYEIGQYCDGLVPDGYGGLEPRFTCNLVLNTQEDAYQVISTLASIFRGMAYWASGSVACSQDRPEGALHLVTPAHVVDGSLSYGGTDLKSRHTVCLVTWNNPLDGGRPDIEPVEDAAGIRRYGWRQTDKVSVGCRSRGQAHRCGKWVLETELNETDTLTFVGGLQYADAMPGSILKVLDPEIADVRHSGAVKSATESQVVLDAPVVIEAGEAYLLSVVLPDGAVVDASVLNAPGETDTLDLAAPLPAAPLPNAMWTLSYGEAEARYFRVLANRETKPNLFEISAVEHDPNKYARVEEDFTFDAPTTSRVPTGPLAAPVGLAVQGYIYAQGASPVAGAAFSWAAPIDARVSATEVELARPGETFRYVSATTECSLDLRDLATGLHSFRARFITRLGAVSPWAVLEAQISADPPMPSAVSGLTAIITPAGIALGWTLDPTPWITGYDIAQDGAVLEQGYSGNAYLIPPLAVATYAFAVRERDVFGQVGEWITASVTVQAPSAVQGLTAQIIANNAFLYWGAPTEGSFPTVGYEMRDGATFETAKVIGRKTGTFTLVTESAGGLHTYWVAPLDGAENYGQATSIPVIVQDPPGYVQYSQTPFSFTEGSGTNVGISAAGACQAPYSAEGLITLEDGLTALCLEDGATALTWPGEITPLPELATYAGGIVDLGRVFQNLQITVQVSKTDANGGATVNTFIATRSTEEDAWDESPDSAARNAARFVRVRFEVVSDGAGWSTLTGYSLTVNTQEVKESGLATVASGGFVDVPLSKTYLAITKVSATPKGSGNLAAVADWENPIPTSVRLYLYDPSTGAARTGPISYDVDGQ